MSPIFNPFLLAVSGLFFSLTISSPLSSSPAIAARAPSPIPSGTSVIDHPTGTGPKYLTEDNHHTHDARATSFVPAPSAPSGWAIVPSGVTVTVAPYATGSGTVCPTGSGTAVTKAAHWWPVPSSPPLPDGGKSRRMHLKRAISIDADYCDDHPDDPCCDMDNENAPECPDNGSDGSETDDDRSGTDSDDGYGQGRNGTSKAV